MLLPRKDVRQLSSDIARHAQKGGPGYVLLLGQGCARAARVPAIGDIARERGVAAEPFYEGLCALSSVELDVNLYNLYSSIPVPAFYQDVARLVRAGHFRDIVTTSIDALLEQALFGAGLTRDVDFAVVNLGVAAPQQVRPPSLKRTSDPVRIVKIFESPSHVQATITSSEIGSALRQGGSHGVGLNVIAVGYEFESQPIDRWLAELPGKMWWVSPTPPQSPAFDAIVAEQAKPPVMIAGPNAEPTEFFRQIALSLSTRSGDESDPRLPALQDELSRAYAIRLNLELAIAQGDRDPKLKAQLDYQVRWITELEREMRAVESEVRSLPSVKPRVVGVLERIAGSVRVAADDPNVPVDADTTSFLDSQVETVKQQYDAPQPNEHVVSAAISATAVIADRLGEQVVERALIDELASLTAPSTEVSS